MLFSTRYADYDAFAWFYDRYWGSTFLTQYYDVVTRTALSQIDKGCNVLDLCCGSGQLAARLGETGYRVSGIDGSAELLKRAHEHAPQVEFTASDARTFTIIEKFDLVLSTFDSINHVMDLAQLGNVFNNVYSSLRKDGLFFFDVSTEEGYRGRWRGSSSIVEQDHVIASSSSYDAETKEAVQRHTTFVLDKKWKRLDIAIVQRSYSKDEITTRLTKSLFRNIKTFDAQRDLGKQEVGRLFFLCSK